MKDNDNANGDDDPNREFVELMQRQQDAVKAGQMDEADALTQELFAIAANQVNENPRPEWDLEEEARSYEAAGDWQAAEAAYRKALEITDAAGEAVWQCKAHSNLSSLFQLIGNRDAALAQARLAIEYARRMDFSIWLAMTLGLEASVALECTLVADALAAIQEAIQIVERENPNDTVLYGKCLVLRADCFRQTGELGRAGADLEIALKKFQPLEGMEFAGGVHSGIANWWTIKARLLTDLNDCGAALHAWRKAISSARHVASLPHCEGPYSDNFLATRTWEYGKALSAAGCAKEAEQAFMESRGIRSKIGLPFFS